MNTWRSWRWPPTIEDPRLGDRAGRRRARGRGPAAVPVPGPFRSAERARVVPPPASDLAAADATSQVAVLAGGCFWGVQGVFQHVDGRRPARCPAMPAATRRQRPLRDGRRGGDAATPRPCRSPSTRAQVSYGALLQIYFSVAHDPTQLNRQGPDVGTQYRSTIFPADAEQARVAKAYIAQLERRAAFDAPIVTTIEPGRPFYPAEDYHQDYLTLHPDPALHRHQRPAEDRPAEAAVPGPLSRSPRTGPVPLGADRVTGPAR